MIRLVWLRDDRPLLAPTPEEPRRKIHGPRVFEASLSFYHKARHPSLIKYDLLEKFRPKLGDDLTEKLHKQAQQGEDTTPLNDLGYRDLQEVAKREGIKAHGTHEELLRRVQDHEE